MTWRERSDWTRTSEAKIFRAREEVKNRYPAEGVSPRGYWFTVGSRFGENVPSGLDQTKLGVGAPAPAPNAVVTAFESRRENGKASELRSEAFSLAPPTGLEPVTLRLTVECSAN